MAGSGLLDSISGSGRWGGPYGLDQGRLSPALLVLFSALPPLLTLGHVPPLSVLSYPFTLDRTDLPRRAGVRTRNVCKTLRAAIFISRPAPFPGCRLGAPELLPAPQLLQSLSSPQAPTVSMTLSPALVLGPGPRLRGEWAKHGTWRGWFHCKGLQAPRVGSDPLLSRTWSGSGVPESKAPVPPLML